MRGKVRYNQNYISRSMENFFLHCQLLPIERKIVKDCLKAQLQYGKLTNRRWEAIIRIYQKHKKLKDGEEETTNDKNN